MQYGLHNTLYILISLSTQRESQGEKVPVAALQEQSSPSTDDSFIIFKSDNYSDDTTRKTPTRTENIFSST